MKTEDQKKILFITTRNILNTCGELRLIKNRTIALYEQFGITCDFLHLNHKKITSPEAIGAGSTISVVNTSLYNPFVQFRSNTAFKKLIRDRLFSDNYEAVIISGAPQYIKTVKKYSKSLKTVADIHGTIEELVEFKDVKFQKQALRTALYRLSKIREKKFLPQYDGILTVSEELKKALQEDYGCDAQFFVVPCSVKKTDLSQEKLLDLRSKARKQYSISDGERVFIYSGGISKWQCVDETVALFKRIDSKLGGKNRLFIFSQGADTLRKYETDNIYVGSLKADEVKNVLPMGDFAFLIRDNFKTNRVAYPNKFLEYVESGLQVITTPYIGDVSEQTQKYQVGFIFDNNIAELCNYINKNTTYLSDLKMRQELINNVCFENRLKPFVEWCGK